MKQFAILGYPLVHTLSPQLHQLLAAQWGEELEYTIREVPPQDWDASLPGLLALDGFNITIPYKLRIMEQMDRLDATAQRHGAMNVAVREADGSFTGYNTDCIGFTRCLEEKGIPLAGSVCVLGCGGAGRMFATEAAGHGCPVTIAVRPTEKAQAEARQVAEHIRALCPQVPVTVTTLDALRGGFDLVVNATPVGMFPHTQESPVAPQALAGTKYLFDCIYNPAETRLMQLAREAGCLRVAGGMKMLVWQAAAAQELWYRRKFTPQQVAQVIRQMEGGR